jgi:crotonobetainyl-CoA:carnitine CoA-transferase CaiB-like acyl-CoA transferase
MRDPHLAARGRFETIDHADAGRHAYYRPFPVSFSACELRNQRPAPLFGQHNVEVLGGLLGCSAERLRQLAEQHVIGDAPRPAPPPA